MDNAPIHKHGDIQLYIEGRGYGCVYLLPYLPELNSIEQFWSVVKSKLKREALLEEETLTSRISDACNKKEKQSADEKYGETLFIDEKRDDLLLLFAIFSTNTFIRSHIEQICNIAKKHMWSKKKYIANYLGQTLFLSGMTFLWSTTFIESPPFTIYRPHKK
ncbi:hypothetical protein PHYBLDRAFT_58545 [Phycomyces blakesleeanus NRRL 1555(-)]|uniref:Tc1-like transposase DDE domain-containing protein n=1 Tax=Phycomyces blakesleeanus (strain ATCC 8743b / DSM 1359 / FGSC 10004 / NBRC 33097 / NRRL 1555) TaxID=763407 RepID=A0A167QCT6_PHYB8|nr:hypothetical protein PHYBLDRAFT_58545 [Phycomyces blakesleeanus NRRL 1555(-)]OAD79497.1 hypothetical protein PHYBLDRAFT_58545 [Phycomyces blakesleeanus NRRL 1555(-)]|eukprot:XP_018297537.1 hypothetical protein PHYBLDRAFT_58545 [Phycomyces blakesleeanus NRRL 1555(-)]